MNLEPRVLTGSLVRLEPLTMDMVPAVTAVAMHAEIWTYLDEATPTRQGVSDLVSEAVQEQQQGLRIPFVIVELATSEVIGSISYLDIQRKHRGVEIGWAWVTPSRWGTGAGHEAAELLLRHAFQSAGAIRVVFKTDSRNVRSRRAIERLGAVREGVFRNHRILRDGHRRDSIFYSVIDQDWAARDHSVA